jgi:hypothetical protein
MCTFRRFIDLIIFVGSISQFVLELFKIYLLSNIFLNHADSQNCILIIWITFQVQYHELFEYEPPRRSVIPFMTHHKHHGRSLQVNPCFNPNSCLNPRFNPNTNPDLNRHLNINLDSTSNTYLLTQSSYVIATLGIQTLLLSYTNLIFKSYSNYIQSVF